jgi:hypothetical protein
VGPFFRFPSSLSKPEQMQKAKINGLERIISPLNAMNEDSFMKIFNRCAAMPALWNENGVGQRPTIDKEDL